MNFLRSGLLAAILLLLSACEEQIIHHLSEREANRLLTSLAVANITATKIKQPDGTWALSVERTDAVRALTFLSERRLMREQEQALPQSSSMVTSREDQRIRSERALSGQLETTLSSIPGVVESRVHLNLPIVDPIFGQPIGRQKGSGSVLVVVERQYGDSPDTVDRAEIANLVAGAAGIPPEAITIVVRRLEEALPAESATSSPEIPLAARGVNAATPQSEDAGAEDAGVKSDAAVRLEREPARNAWDSLLQFRGVLLPIAGFLIMLGGGGILVVVFMKPKGFGRLPPITRNAGGEFA